VLANLTGAVEFGEQNTFLFSRRPRMKVAGNLIATCVLAVSMAAFAQSSGEMKHDDNMKQDTMKNDSTQQDCRRIRLRKTARNRRRPRKTK